MKSPKTLYSALNHAARKPRHSSLLLWALLIMVMLSGLMYLGFKIKQQRTENSLQHQPITTKVGLTGATLLALEKTLATLKSLKLINPTIYKTKIILTDDLASDKTQNHAVLWLQEPKQITLVKATVHAGVDLSELPERDLNAKTMIIHLPPARMTLTQIDNVTMYDVKTGQPSTVQMGLSLTREQEKNIKAQIEREFCQSGVLQTTTENTRQHVISLLDAMKVSAVVRVVEPVGCQQAAS